MTNIDLIVSWFSIQFLINNMIGCVVYATFIAHKTDIFVDLVRMICGKTSQKAL